MTEVDYLEMIRQLPDVDPAIGEEPRSYGRRGESMILWRSVLGLVVVASLVVGCGGSGEELSRVDAGVTDLGSDDAGRGDSGVGDTVTGDGGKAETEDEGDAGFGHGEEQTVTFVPAPVPELNTTPGPDDAPVYLFLYMHTEDHINHELSEERYVRIVPVLAETAAAAPDAGLVWTIMFQGADARTVAERNGETGVADMLKKHASDGIIEFGYHAYHDPTYFNRPQLSFTADTLWEELVTGLLSWVSCEKNPLQGGCVAETGGGVMAILDNFGPVDAVSGLYTFKAASIEGGAGRHAVWKHLPKRLVGFAFPDHGPADDAEDYLTNLGNLMEILTPSIDTSGAVLWIDNVIKLNDGNPVQNIGTVVMKEGVADAKDKLFALDRTRPHIFNVHMGDKYLYTGQGTSPTKWAYANPDNPELPPEYLLTPEISEERYQDTFKTLQWLANEFVAANPGSRFVRAQEIIELVAPPEYWTVTADTLDVLARWALLNWDGAPPNWVSDGEEFYSIRDLFVLLVLSFGGGFPDSQQLPMAYGPHADSAASVAEVTVSAQSVVEVAADLAPLFAPSADWELTPSCIVAAEYELGGVKLSAAQFLYAMATVYASIAAGAPVTEVTVPATASMPETLEILDKLGCPACQGSSWSLKPARIR